MEEGASAHQILGCSEPQLTGNARISIPHEVTLHTAA